MTDIKKKYKLVINTLDGQICRLTRENNELDKMLEVAINLLYEEIFVEYTISNGRIIGTIHTRGKEEIKEYLRRKANGL